ncbi:unnamed protein product [Durusdinium trenchii]|uniref:Replication protein A subunit n=1 Tax=Durusdinium trenchii TaxID=1381693 RepID=A0ABP0LZN8_9DINO
MLKPASAAGQQAAVKLTAGCIRRLAEGVPCATLAPLVQVVAKRVGRDNAQDEFADRRTTLSISDGQHFMLAILSPDIQDPAEGSIIQLLEWKRGAYEGLPAIFLNDWDQSSAQVFDVVGPPVGIHTISLGTPDRVEKVEQAGANLPCVTSAAMAPPRPVATPMRRRMSPDMPLSDPVETSPGPGRPTAHTAHAAHGPSGVSSLPLVPIAQLSLSMPRCRVRARVLSKSGIRAFTNSRGSSQLFSMDLMDSDGACTRATCFGVAVDKFYPAIQVKKIYEITGASVKQANPRYCRYPMELTLDERGAFLTALPEDGTIPPIPYKFVPIAELSLAVLGTSCDVLGVVHSLEDPVSVVTKNGPRMKRQAILLDSSKASIALNLWAEKAEIELAVGMVVFVRAARVSEFQGRTLDLNEASFVETNPDDPRAFQLQAWHQSCGQDEPIRPLSGLVSGGRGKKRNLAEALAEDSLLANQGERSSSARTVNFHQVSATVVAVRNDRAPFYWVENGQCAAGHICPEPAARFNLSLQVADAFACVHCQAFGEEAELLADVPAAELAVLDDERMAGNLQAEKTYTRIFRNMLFRRWAFTLKCRKENYEGRVRLQVSVDRLAPVDSVAESHRMLQEMKSMALHVNL